MLSFSLSLNAFPLTSDDDDDDDDDGINNKPTERPTDRMRRRGEQRGAASGSDALQGRRQFPSHGMLTYASVGKLAFVWNHASLRYKGKIREREQELDYRVTLKG